MKMTASSRTIVSIVVVVALAIAFWMLFIGPKRKEAEELGSQAEQLQSTLVQTQSAVVAGEQAQREFPRDYQQLVVLGKAVPAGDESASLLVQLNHIADHASVKFESLKVGAADSAETEAPVEETAPEPEAEAPAAEGSSGVPAAASAPTEAAASLQPIGASVGAAGLSTLPYDLAFKGNFFHVADFIGGIDSMVHTGHDLAVDGRLVTLDGFALSGNSETGFPDLNANFSVTTYLVPPGQGITAGASPTQPTEAAANPSATTSSLR